MEPVRFKYHGECDLCHTIFTVWIKMPHPTENLIFGCPFCREGFVDTKPKMD
jgi:hypothetical protein